MGYFPYSFEFSETGFSYTEFGEKVANTEEAAKDIASFLYIFFDTFKSFQNRKFHFAGESYAVSLPEYKLNSLMSYRVDTYPYSLPNFMSRIS